MIKYNSNSPLKKGVVQMGRGLFCALPKGGGSKKGVVAYNTKWSGRESKEGGTVCLQCIGENPPPYLYKKIGFGIVQVISEVNFIVKILRIAPTELSRMFLLRCIFIMRLN